MENTEIVEIKRNKRYNGFRLIVKVKGLRMFTCIAQTIRIAIDLIKFAYEVWKDHKNNLI